MKKITFQGIELEYQTIWEDGGEFGDFPVTYFYQGTVTETRKKWLFFGPKITTVLPREVFKIYADSDSAEHSKEWWRVAIQSKVDLMHRAEELSRGELI